MDEDISRFEQDCAQAGVTPRQALESGGVHPSLWSKWRSGAVSPTLRNFSAARRGLAALQRRPAIVKRRDFDGPGGFLAFMQASPLYGIELDIPPRKIERERPVDLPDDF